MGKRIAVVGTGAVGGYTGAHMARAGEDVTLIDIRPGPSHPTDYEFLHRTSEPMHKL